MGGLMSRNKGKRAEREVIDLLQPIVDHVYSTLNRKAPVLQRNTLQSDRGGMDVVGLQWIAIEVKHCEQCGGYQLKEWWEQAEQQAKESMYQPCHPVLFYRRNGVPFRVRMRGFIGTHACVVDVSVDDFSWWFFNNLRLELT